MMESSTAQGRLFRSCEILFGSDLTITREFLDYLQLSGLKTAYRRRAMETHPDRIVGNGPLLLQRNKVSFYAVQEAYEDLLHFLKTREGSRRSADCRVPKTASSNPCKKPSAPPHWPCGEQAYNSGSRDRQRPFFRQTIKPIILPNDGNRSRVYTNTEDLYQGVLPHRPLLFGHFLYYSGLANWRTIARILIWQRIERPRLGELGRRFGIFKHEDITRILQNKVPLQPFGQTARRLGIVTDNQLRSLIFQQQRLQKKFGTILLEKKLVNHHELQELLFHFQHHNASIRPQ